VEGNRGEVCPLQLETVDPAVEDGRKGRRARKRAGVGTSRHFVFLL